MRVGACTTKQPACWVSVEFYFAIASKKELELLFASFTG